MPIFVSRFSSQRSLVGNFLSPRPQTGAEEAGGAIDQNRSSRAAEVSRAAQRGTGNPRQEDRLELTERQAVGPARPPAEAPPPTRVETPPSPPAEAPPNAGDADEGQNTPAPPRINRVLSNLTIVEQLRLRRTGIQAGPAAEAGAATVQPAGIAGRVEPRQEAQPAGLNVRMGGTAGGGVAAAEAGGAPAPLRANLQPTIQQENRLASRNAVPERLNGLLDRLSPEGVQNPARNPDAGPPGLDRPQETAETSALAGAPQEAGAFVVPRDGEGRMGAETPALQQRQPEPAEPIPREEQEQQLQEDLRTIASGLQSDAAIESRQNVEQTARSAQQAAQQSQRQEVRENEMQIRSLQGEQRQLQQEIQSTDQAIRQLQSRNSRLQARSSSSVNSGSSLDILVQ